MIHDHYWKDKPPSAPFTTPSKRLEEYLELIRKAHEYDKINSQPECIKPEYEQIRKIVEDILEDREKNRNK